MPAPIVARLRGTIRCASAFLPLLLVVSPAGAQPSFAMDDVFALANVSVADVSADGRHVLVTSAALRDRIGSDNYRFGDPTYIGPGVSDVVLVDTRTGARRPVFPMKRQVRSASFSPDGSRLALLVMEGDAFRLGLVDVASARVRLVQPPRGRLFDEQSGLQWTADGSRLLVGLRSTEWHTEARQRFVDEVEGPIVVRSSEDPFLSWEAIRRLSLRRIPALFDVAASRFSELAGESMLGGFAITDDGRLLRTELDITKKTDYDEIFGRESALTVRPTDGGDERTVLETTKGLSGFRWSGDGKSFAYAKEGVVFFATLDAEEPRRIAGPAEARRDTAAAPADSAARAAERERRRKERFTPMRLSHDGQTLVASNGEGWWFIDTTSGEREMFLEVPSGEEAEQDETRPRWSLLGWSRDARTLYLGEESRTEWSRAIHRYDRVARQRTELMRGDAQIGGFTVSADGSTVVYTRTETNRPSEVWVADANLGNARQLTDSNPWLRDRQLGAARLIDYLDVDGKKLHGVLYLPPGYREGTRVPTVFLVYEEFFDPRFNATVAFLNAHGYAVIQPSVRLERGYPGEAWLKGVTAAANKLIEMGIADAEKLGVHGTSYGGYATNLLVTQTQRFKAAINISGKVDMISFYTDSPRLGTRNTHAPEKSQDRIGGTLWEEPQKYIAHSAIMFADRITTPLLLLTGQQDHNVPERTTSEMFYALRRLGKRVEWVSYIDGGHGMPTTTEAEVVDYHQRILGWYDRYLKGSASAESTEG